MLFSRRHRGRRRLSQQLPLAPLKPRARVGVPEAGSCSNSPATISELTLVLARIQTGSPTHHLYGRLWGSLHVSWRCVGQKQRLCVFHFEPGKQKEAR